MTWVAGLGLAVLAVTLVLTASALVDRQGDVDRAEASAVAERAAGQVVVGVSSAAAALERTATSVCAGSTPAVDSAGVTAVACVRADGSLLDPNDQIESVLAAPVVETALARARDGGSTVLSGPTGDAAIHTVVVVPVYGLPDGVASITPPAPSTVVAARGADR